MKGRKGHYLQVLFLERFWAAWENEEVFRMGSYGWDQNQWVKYTYKKNIFLVEE